MLDAAITVTPAISHRVIRTGLGTRRSEHELFRNNSVGKDSAFRGVNAPVTLITKSILINDETYIKPQFWLIIHVKSTCTRLRRSIISFERNRAFRNVLGVMICRPKAKGRNGHLQIHKTPILDEYLTLNGQEIGLRNKMEFQRTAGDPGAEQYVNYPPIISLSMGFFVSLWVSRAPKSVMLSSS